MKSFVILALLFAVTNGATLLGKSSCTWGPSYWCKNMNNAKQCQAVGHCAEKQWNQHVNRESLPCKMCEEVFEVVNGMLEKNSTKQEVEGELMNMCTQLPGSFVSECKMAISENFDLIYDEAVMLLNNGGVFCSALGLCQRASEENLKMNGEMDKLFDQAKEAYKNTQLPAAVVTLTEAQSDECQDCTSFFNDFVDVVKNQKNVVDYWQNLIVQECELLGPGISNLCQEELTKEFTILLNQMAAQDAATVCKDISMCTSSAAKQGASKQCSDCNNFFTDLQNDIANQGQITASIEAMLKKSCDQAPKTLQPVCLSVISQAMEGAWKLIGKNPTESICETLFFCQETKVAVAPAVTNCTDCMNFMTDVKNVALNDPTVVNTLVKLVKQECKRLDEDFEILLCDEYSEDLVRKALHEGQIMDVGAVCTSIEMCSSSPSQGHFGGDVCNDCVRFTQDWKDVLQHDPSYINSRLSMAGKAICQNAGGFLKNICEEKIEDVLRDALVEFNSTSAADECKRVAMCTKQTTADAATVHTVKLHHDKKLKLRYTASIVCETCTAVSQALDKVISKKSTEDQIKAALDQVCSSVPQQFQDACKDLVDVYTPEIIGIIQQGLEGEMCQYLGLCPQKKEEAVKSDLPCDVCITVAKQLDDMITSSSTEAEIEQALGQVCELLPADLRDTCKTLIATYTPQLIDLLMQEISPKEICSTLGLCPESAKKLKVRSEMTCGICLTVATELDKMVKPDDLKADVEKALDMVCGVLPSKDAPLCKEYVSAFAPELIDMLLQELSPKKMCSMLGFCSTTAVAEKSQVVETKVQDSPYCGICMLVAGQLEKSLSKDATKAEIEQALDQVCGLLPGQYKDECDQLVTQYTPMIIQLLVAEVTPKQLCSELKLCPASKESIEVKGETKCEVCRFVVSIVDGLLKKKTTEEEIRNSLQGTCVLLPHTVADHCRSFVANHVDNIMELLKKMEEVSPEHICAMIGSCQPNKAENNKAVTEMEKDAPEPKQLTADAASTKLKFKPYQDGTACDVCKLVVEDAEQQLSANATEEEIETELKKACSVLPGQSQQFCNDVINEYIPEIIDAIIDKGDALTVCTSVGLCKQRRLIGANPCTFGPSFWCKNRTNAILCNAVSHCMKHVW